MSSSLHQELSPYYSKEFHTKSHSLTGFKKESVEVSKHSYQEIINDHQHLSENILNMTGTSVDRKFSKLIYN